ncbi:MAG: DUF2497 domain-containing protein [Rhodospirillales bacterium]|nr:DUF2497 domain-containing protein [Rhodospirillales bacterium]
MSVTGDKPKPEEAMGDILSSIKRIINEDQTGTAAPSESPPPDGDEEVLELTELEEDETEEKTLITSIFGEKPLQTRGLPPLPETACGASEVEMRSNRAVVEQLKGLREAAKIAKAINAEDQVTDAGVNAYVLKAIEPLAEAWVKENLPGLAEAQVKDVLRTAVQAWIDTHLEDLVERIVQEEVSKMVEQASRG